MMATPTAFKKDTRAEFEVHRDIANTYIASHPTTLLCSTPDMTTPNARRKAVEKGYQKGFPDIFKADPRIRVVHDVEGAKIHIHVCPGVFDEVKNARGRVSAEQKVVHRALEDRGYQVNVPHSVPEAQAAVVAYEEGWRPLYKGRITVSLKSGRVTAPRAPKSPVVLPRKRTRPKRVTSKRRASVRTKPQKRRRVVRRRRSRR